MQMENKYLDSFMDRDTVKVKSAQDNYQLYADRAQAKALLKTEKDEDEIKKLQAQIKDITEKIKK